MYTDEEIVAMGLECLEERLGSVDMQRFIASILRDPGNYTIERRAVFDDMSVEDVRRETSAYCREHPISEEARARLDRYRAEHDGDT